jgi:hypothetical protein
MIEAPLLQLPCDAHSLNVSLQVVSMPIAWVRHCKWSVTWGTGRRLRELSHESTLRSALLRSRPIRPSTCKTLGVNLSPQDLDSF